jgi:hypothetical protein
MLREHLWKIITLDFLRSSGGEGDERRLEVKNDDHDDDEKQHHPPTKIIDMGDSCSKISSPPVMEDNTKQAAKVNGEETGATHSPAVSGSKRSRDGKFSSLRRSIFRVNSRVDRGGSTSGSDANGIPHSPRARASTYSHVHDAVMYNLSEAETSKHDQTVPMGESEFFTLVLSSYSSLMAHLLLLHRRCWSEKSWEYMFFEYQFAMSQCHHTTDRLLFGV